MPTIVNKPGSPRFAGEAGKKTGGRRAVGFFLEFVITVIVMWLLFALAGRILPRIALREISKLTDTKINVESVDFKFDGSVSINNLVVRPPAGAEYDNSILNARTVNVRFRFGSLLRFHPQVKEIYVNDFTLRALYDSNNGDWNLSAMKIQTPQNGPTRLPLIWFENGKVEFSKVQDNRIRVIASTPVSMGLRPAEKIIGVGGYSFDITSAPRQSFEKSAIGGNWKPGRIVLAGRLSSRDIPGFERPWGIKSLDVQFNYDSNKSCWLTAKVKEFTCPADETRNLFGFDTKAMLAKAPFLDAIQNFFNRYNPSGKIDIDLDAWANLDQIDKGAITGKIICQDVNLCDRNFAYKVEHLTGRIDVTDKSVKLNKLTGRHGDTVLNFGGWATDAGPFWKYHLQITSENMLLDNDLYNALTRDEQKLWSAFSPSGIVATNYSRSQMSPTDVQTALTVRLIDVNARYTDFSYPLKNTNGLMFFGSDSVVFSNVVSEWEDRRIILNGKVTFGGRQQPAYDLLINGENVPLDATLEQALPAAQKEFYNQFEMSGRVDANIKVISTSGTKAGGFTAEVFPKNSSIKAKMIPIAIDNVTGKLTIDPRVVNIENLTGDYKSGTVNLSGQIWPRDGQAQLGYCLSMKAQKIELSDELANNLPGQMAVLLSKLHPGGEVSVTADLSKDAVIDCGPDRLIID
jgi:hypothetical protein